MAKPATERITNIDEKIKHLQQQKKAILAREKERERKARTRQLIQKGALVEKYLPSMPDDLLVHSLEMVRAFLIAEEKIRGERFTATEMEFIAKRLNDILFQD